MGAQLTTRLGHFGGLKLMLHQLWVRGGVGFSKRLPEREILASVKRVLNGAATIVVVQDLEIFVNDGSTGDAR